MTGRPLISVLMGVYNEEEYLSKAIASILNQNYSNLEFLIVDDASTDETPNVLASYDDPRITVIENETNKGLTTSLNRALDRAEGKYVARQDADDISESERFTRQVSFLERNDNVAVVGTGTHLIDGNGDVVDLRIGYCNPDFEDFLEKSHLVHGSILARRSVLEELGGYDELFRYGQDYELWLRLSQRYEIANVPEPLYRLRIHDDSVYFSRKDESGLYSVLARDLAMNNAEESVRKEIEKNGIRYYYDLLDDDQRCEFHHDLATRYLRYGHVEPALEECRKARSYCGANPKNAVLTALAYTGPQGTQTVRWAMRRYLNVKTKLRNRINCPYETE